MPTILLLNGPNLNLLGTREPELYGRTTLAEIEARLKALAAEAGVELECLQTNHEGEMIEAIHGARGRCVGCILNPGGLTHTSVALRDAIAGSGLPVIEVHLSNLHKREPFRQVSFVSGVAAGTVSGFGALGYELALRAALALWVKRPRAGKGPAGKKARR